MKNVKKISIICLLLFTFLLEAKEQMVYSVSKEAGNRDNYVIELLKKAVEKTKGEHGLLKIVPSDSPSDSIKRRAIQVEKKRTDVLWAVSNSNLEKKLIPVRIPLYKGIFGFRIFLINKTDQKKFSKIDKLDDLKKFSFGQSHDSDDIKILKASGFNVVKSTSFKGMFKMLSNKRFDSLPRSVNEVFTDIKQFGKELPSLKIEDKLILYYNKPVYFFFNDKKLAKRIEMGLNKMVKDGSFDSHFKKRYKNILDKANLAERNIVRIDNPLLNEKTLPLSRKKLWYNIVEGMEAYGVVINLSGKQRMLTQKMSKETMLISLGVDVQKNLENLKATSSLFDKTLKGLRDGNKELRLPATKNRKIVKELDKVRKIWTPFQKVINEVIKNGKVTKDQVAFIAEKNVPLLKQMNKCVWLFERESAKGGVATDPYLATALNLSGRQRMLSQKMTKEFLLISSGYKVTDTQVALRKTYSLFDHTLKGLLDGDKVLHLKRTGKPHIRKQLKKVMGLWGKFKPILEIAAKASVPSITPEQIKNIAVENLPLLKEMNAAVGMYEKEAE